MLLDISFCKCKVTYEETTIDKKDIKDKQLTFEKISFFQRSDKTEVPNNIKMV